MPFLGAPSCPLFLHTIVWCCVLLYDRRYHLSAGLSSIEDDPTRSTWCRRYHALQFLAVIELIVSSCAHLHVSLFCCAFAIDNPKPENCTTASSPIQGGEGATPWDGAVKATCI